MPKRKARSSLLPERLVARLWRNRASRGTLQAQDGRNLRVIYPGRPNGGPGPDFRDALLKWEGSPIIQGDVEIHRDPAAWRQHGHHQDLRYNNVLLHVVLRSSPSHTVRRQDGFAVPVVGLDTAPDTLAPRESGVPEATARWRLQEWRGLSQARLRLLLDQAGERRFLDRSARLQAELRHEDIEELLYRGMLEALGYSQNRGPFLELGRRLPWRTVRSAGLGLSQELRLPAITRWMMAGAGLLPKSSLALAGPLRRITPLEPGAWCFAGVRPANRPDRRIAGAAVLLARHLDTGWLAGFLPLVQEASVNPLGSTLTVVQDGVTLVGRSRALDMAVNVILPMVHAWCVVNDNPELARSCLTLYQVTPRLADNEITREMAKLLRRGALSIGGGARRQQGLLHLYRLLLNGALASPDEESATRERGNSLTVSEGGLRPPSELPLGGSCEGVL